MTPRPTSPTQPLQAPKILSPLVALLAIVAMVIAGCSNSGDEEQVTPSSELFGYAVDVPLQTSNAGSALGASIKAEVLTARLYPGPFTQGPKGQWIPNRDIAEGQLLPGVQQRAIFKINENAKFSDGVPLTCESFLLAYTAGVMPGLFHSYMPIMNEVQSVECKPNARELAVVFKDGYGPRWRQVFSGGTLLPAHAIAQHAGLTLESLNTALHNQNWNALADVATAWNQGYELDNFAQDLQVSVGPYQIRSVGASGEVVLKRNEHFAGQPAEIPELVIWPRGADLQRLREDDVLRAADLASAQDLSWLQRDDPNKPVDIEELEGVLTDSLLLSDTGVFATPNARKAFAACVDQKAVAEASSKSSGIDVAPVTVRTLRAGDPSGALLKDIAEPHLNPNIDAAKALSGTTVRIGYSGPDARKAKMVEAIKRSCEPAGLTIVDASEDGGTFEQLRWDAAGQQGGAYNPNGTLDALLLAVDPVEDFGGTAKSNADIEGLRKDEFDSWEAVLTVPLSTQPRVQIHDRAVGNVVANTDGRGLGWNLDRWSYQRE